MITTHRTIDDADGRFWRYGRFSVCRRLFAWAPKVHHYVGKITPDTPIPVPGKGENSWDCGDDATYSMSGPYTTAAEAVAAVVGSVYRSRTQYGPGPEWRPTEAVR